MEVKRELGEIVTIEIPEKVAHQAREVAAHTQRRLEDVLVEWIDHAVSELPVESLPDDQLLALCDIQLEAEQQEELSELLARNREGLLQDEERPLLDELMQIYRRGLVRKARALKVAVERGLRASLN
ncbi:MAG: hypothetical protein A2Z04_07255 [Chloroflexi bacterium RBG_16_57_9]|nr:MAG: hypothetical protein A2Z04_07255 [Chloroflexi bacterium RBG_16_57_9]